MGTMRATLVIPGSTPHPKATVPMGALALLPLWIVLPGSVLAASHRPESFVLPNGLRVIMQTDPRITIVHAPVRQAHLMLGFPIAQASEPEGPGLDFLAFTLGRGESSRLAQKVKIVAGEAHVI